MCANLGRWWGGDPSRTPDAPHGIGESLSPRHFFHTTFTLNREKSDPTRPKPDTPGGEGGYLGGGTANAMGGESYP